MHFISLLVFVSKYTSLEVLSYVLTRIGCLFHEEKEPTEYMENMLADLPVDDSRISAQVARTFLPAIVKCFDQNIYIKKLGLYFSALIGHKSGYKVIVLYKCRKQLSSRQRVTGQPRYIYTLTSLAQRGNPFTSPRIISIL
jgi:hypothetical protein